MLPVSYPKKGQGLEYMGSKYRNIKVEIEGYKFDSKKEAEFYQELVLRKKAGDIMDFKVKPKIQIFSEQESGKCILGWFWADYRGLTAWQKGVFTYTPDFTIHHRSGQE